MNASLYNATTLASTENKVAGLYEVFEATFHS